MGHGKFPMRTQVVSGFSPGGYEEYGRAFMGTFYPHWPESVSVAVYVEENCQAPEFVDQRLLSEIPGCMEFITKYKDDPRATGKEPVPGWRKKDERAGYAWRFDAVRFCRQLFIPQHAVSQLHDGDIFCWLDGDVITYKDVPEEFIDNLLRENDLVYLGRQNGATELGFWALRINPLTRSFVAELAVLCTSEQIFKMPEWHSGFVWDRIRENYEELGMKARNLTPMGQGHVWFQCELGCYTDHLKGSDRKLRGWSIERNQQLGGLSNSRPKRSTPSNVPNGKEMIDFVTSANGPAPRPQDAIMVGVDNKDDLLSMLSRAKRTFAFEPNPARYKALAEEFGHHHRLTLYNSAVLDGCGTVKRMDAGGYINDPEGEIPFVCLDQLVPELQSCDIVRLNAGGAEQAVLHGMRRILADHKPLLIIRICGKGKRYGNKDWQLQVLLEDHFNYEAVLHAHPYYAFRYTGL